MAFWSAFRKGKDYWNNFRSSRMNGEGFFKKYQAKFFSSRYSELYFTPSLLKPTLFTIGVVGTTLYVVNSDQVRAWSKQQERAFQIRQIVKQRNKNEDPSLSTWLGSIPPSNQALYGLMGANAAVFGMWNIPSLYPFMYSWFMHGIADRSVLPMLLSCFSHMNIAHIAFNMIAFNSFGTNVGYLMGREQLLALYISGGVFASYCSHLSLMWRKNITRSLGASGSIYSIIAASAILIPNSNLSLIFFPFVSFPSSTLLPCLLAFEFVGLAMMLKRGRGFFGFDHAAHLGGAAFGMGYLKWLESQGRLKSYRNYKRLD